MRSLFFRGLPIVLVLFLLGLNLSSPAQADTQRFTLVNYVPDDVFLCVGGRSNPERDFLNEYWGEVFDALVDSGVCDDVWKLINSLLGEEQQGELDHLRARVHELMRGVNWNELCGEMAFGERMAHPVRTAGSGMVVGAPDLVVLFGSAAGSSDENYRGLVAILQALVEEVNRLADAQVLTAENITDHGAEVVRVNLLGMVAGAPPMPIAVGRRGDVLFATFGDEILTDVIGLLAGTASKSSIASTQRFQDAFAKLPPAEDSLVFFDMQNMLKPFRTIFDTIVAAAGSAGDVIQNTGENREAAKLTTRAFLAYQAGKIDDALRLTQQAYEADPKDSTVLYNLACFHALLGHRDEALSFLEQAVEAGFTAPGKIGSDSDLTSLREDSRFQAAVARASELARLYSAEDQIVNSTRSGEAYQLSMQAWKVYEDKDYEQGLKLVEQAYAVAPDDSRVLYSLACFHALLGHDDKALAFLERAVAGGFYAPDHIAKDPDLERIRNTERYEKALLLARQKAAELGATESQGAQETWQNVATRIFDAVGVLDYTAAVEHTDGYSVYSDTVAVLVSGADQRPIYSILRPAVDMERFDRFLPVETESFSVDGGIDLEQLYVFIEDLIRDTGPGGQQVLQKWEEIQKDLGLNVRTDILSWIAGDSVSVTLADQAGSVWMLRVRDEDRAREKVAAGVEMLSEHLAELMSNMPMLAMLSLRSSPVKDERLEGFRSLRFGISPQSFVWGVRDGFLIFGSSADAVALCLATAAGDHPGIRENSRVMSEALVPEGRFVHVSLSDQRHLGVQIAQGLTIASTISGMFTIAIPEEKPRRFIAGLAGIAAKLGPVALKIDFFKSVAMKTTFDGQAWHTQMVTHYVSPEERQRTRAVEHAESAAEEGGADDTDDD